jgi:hypothetical protein
VVRVATDPRRALGLAVVPLLAALTLAGCTGPSERSERSERSDPTSSSAQAPATDGPSTGPTTPSTPTTPTAPSTSSSEPTPTRRPVAPAKFEPGRAMADVRLLAGRIGPRLATGPAFREAAALVARRFERHGYAVTTQRFGVPTGDSWGVRVDAGTSRNVVATPPGWRATAPYLLVGAHLDTVAVAPGAEDNASGVAVLLEVARLAAREPTRLPVVLVAFGGEEPVGPGDDQHHFGSMHHVRTLRPAAARNLRAMVAMDRVGVGTSVPVCTGGLSPLRVRDDLLGRARRLGVPAHACRLTTSDHWSFEKAGYVVARLGSTPYPGYHSAGDVPSVVDAGQLGRTGRVIWDWLRAR